MEAKIVGNKLHLEIDLNEGRLSPSGKNYVVGGTGGFRAIDNGISVNVVAISKTPFKMTKAVAKREPVAVN